MTKQKFFGSMWMVLSLLVSINSFAVEKRVFEGMVVGIVDGDTVDVLDSAKLVHRIRLAGIDAPEKGQAFAKISKQFLSDLIFEKIVTVKVTGDGGWNRELGVIFYNNFDVNLEMVKSGHAWVFRKYTSDAALIAAENIAQNAQAGLWRLPATERMPPWEWRKQPRNGGDSG